MKKPMTTLMALLLSISAYGKEQNKAILVEEVILSTTQSSERGQVCKAEMGNPLKRRLKKDIYLIGQVRSTPTSNHKGVVQIVWTGVQVKDKKRPKAYFQKPLISTFKAHSPALSKGTQIDLIGDLDQIVLALESIENGNASLKAQGVEHNPQAAERRVDDAHTLQVQGGGQAGNHAHSGAAAGSSAHGSSVTPHQGEHLDSHMNTTDGRAHSSKGNNAGVGNGQSTSPNGGRRAGYHSPRPAYNRGTNGFNPGQRAGSSRYGVGHFTAPSPSSFSSNSGTPHNASSTTAASNQKTSVPSAEENQKDDLGVGGDDKETAPGGSKGVNGHEEGEASSPVGMDGRDPFGVDHDKPGSPRHHKFAKIEVKTTQEGCRPRIDFEKGRYIIQAKTIKLRDGKVIHESPCGDSEVWYPIKKDYSKCPDEVDAVKRVAYTRFQRYWQDKDGKKHYLDNGCIRDESQPHPFIDDPKNCSHHLDILGRKAWRQAETIYYDRANARQVVAGCHKVGGALPIVDVNHKCKPKHYFEKKLSVIQERSIFMDNGIEHEVLPCRESSKTVPHEFIKAGCTPVVNGRTAIPMVKRQIRYNGKTHQITNDCEPLNPVNLQSSTEGCESQFFDDFNAGRSYQAIRWYFLWHNKKKFVTSCQRSDKYYVHELQFLGYQNRDDLLKAQPRSLVTITVDGRTVSLRTILESNPQKFIDYVKQGTTDRSTGANSERIYYQAFTLWKRPDGSTYEQPGRCWNQAIPQPEGRAYHEYNDHGSTRGW